MIRCRECKFFLNEGIDGYGYCKLSNKERRCSQLCEGLEYERKIERKQQMNNPDLHTALLFLMMNLEDIKNNPMQDKHFVAALTEVLRYFRDNGELKKAYKLQKQSLSEMAKSPWAKMLFGFLTTKISEDNTDAEPPDMNTLIEDFTSDGNIENKINNILGRQQPDGTSQCSFWDDILDQVKK